MRKLIILLVVFFATSCKYNAKNNENIYKLRYFDKMIPPIIVISNGTVLGDSRLMVRDSIGQILGFNDNGFESLKPGDTIIPSVYKKNTKIWH